MLMNKIDTDHNGDISFAEFCNAVDVDLSAH